MFDITKEFKNYALKDKGISSLTMHNHEQYQNSITPMVLEERELRVTMMSVFDRLMMDRTIWLRGVVNDTMSTIVQAQLMFLDNLEQKDIRLHVDTGGGSVKSGLSIIDVMDYVASDIMTINTGMAASMGAVLLGAGTKGKRSSLRFSEVMLHQVSSGFEGTLADMEISLKQTKKYNTLLFELLGEYTNKTPEQVKEDSNRDFWMSSDEALSYGIIDSIIKNKKG
jgi:ATP-dependent Clp protease, protease subunit